MLQVTSLTIFTLCKACLVTRSRVSTSPAELKSDSNRMTVVAICKFKPTPLLPVCMIRKETSAWNAARAAWRSSKLPDSSYDACLT